MPRFKQLGSRDDIFTDEGDIGFVGFNNFSRPDQLPQGMLADSQNGRIGINGEWQVRKGIDLLLAPLSVGVDALTLPFTLPEVGEIGDLTTAYLNDSAVNAVYGSCAFSDPNNESSEYVILAANTKAVAVKLSDGSQTDIDYPALSTISTRVSMIQAFNKVFIFRDGNTAFEWDGVLTGTPAFTKVASGGYSQPVFKNVAVEDISATDGLVSFVIAGDVTADFPENKWLRVYDSGDEHFDATVDEEYRIVSSVYDGGTVETTVKAYMPVIDHDGTGHSGEIITIGRRVSVGLGFSHMPAPAFATYHQRRLIMPFKWTVDAGADSFTTRGIVDEVIASDILDSDTYDQIYGNFRFNAGTADYIVGLHSFSDDILLVLNRNSIHVVQSSGTLETASVNLLTNEVGIVARRSVVQVGNNVMFLSDNGVYGANFQDLYNLRGNEIPLSGPIDATIARINRDYWQDSVAVYFNNRYYIAVPLDGSTYNNAILVFNFLTKNWESIDTLNDTTFSITNMIVGGEGSNRGIFVTNELGGVHKLYTRSDGVDRFVASVGGSEIITPTLGAMTTRQYTANSLDRKKWNSFDFHIQSSESNTSDFDMTAITENIDDIIDVGTLSDFVGSALAIDEDVSIRGRIGNRRGYGLQFQINNTSGRPRVRALKVTSSQAFNSLTKAE